MSTSMKIFHCKGKFLSWILKEHIEKKTILGQKKNSSIPGGLLGLNMRSV